MGSPERPTLWRDSMAAMAPARSCRRQSSVKFSEMAHEEEDGLRKSDVNGRLSLLPIPKAGSISFNCVLLLEEEISV